MRNKLPFLPALILIFFGSGGPTYSSAEDCFLHLLDNMARCESEPGKCRDSLIGGFPEDGPGYKECMCGQRPRSISRNDATSAAVEWQRGKMATPGYHDTNHNGFDDMGATDGTVLSPTLMNIVTRSDVLNPHC